MAAETKDFFISRAGADKDAAIWIARTLEAAGFTCTIQDRDFRLGALFPRSMEKAFENCSAMIAVLSPDYSSSTFCNDEWDVAYALNKKEEGGRLLPVRVAAGRLPALAEALLYVDLVGTTEAEREQKLHAGVIAFRQGGALPDVLAPDTAPITNSTFKTSNFKGRDDELDAVHEALWSDASTSKIAPLTVLHGLGGVGKSAIAREYVRRHLHRYTGAWFVRAEKEATLLGDLAELGFALNRNSRSPEILAAAKAGVREAQTLARQTGRPFLLLFDNVEKPQDLPDWVHGEGLHIVISSRWATWPRDVKTIALDALPVEAARALLLDDTNREAGEGLEQLLEALDGLPLAIVQAGAYLRENPSESFAAYEAAHTRRLGEAPDDWPANQRLVAATFAPSIEQAAAKAPGAPDLLRRAAFFAPEDIPLELLADDPSAEATRKAADALSRYSLWQDGENGFFDPTRSVHRVLQAVVRKSLSPEDMHAHAIGAGERLSAQFDSEPWDPRTWPKIKPLSTHAAALSDLTPDAAARPSLAHALNVAGTYFLERADYESSEPLLRRALKIDEGSHGADHPDVARDLICLGQVLRLTDKFDEAEPLMRRALEIDERTFGADDARVARDLFQLGQLLHQDDRFDEAERMLKRTLEIDEKNFGADHPDVARDLIYLGGLLKDVDRLDEAEAMMRRALDIDEKQETDHSFIARDLVVYGQLLQKTNRLREAEAPMRRALEIDEKVHGASHPNVARDLISLGRLLWDDDRLDDAEASMRRALDIDERTQGSEHTNVARDLICLARVLQDADRSAEAEPLMRRALAIDERKQGGQHTDVARDLIALASLMLEGDRFAEAEPLMQRALEIDEQAQGRKHTDVARDLIVLAELLDETGRLAAAEPMIRRALAIDEARYGLVDSDVSRDLHSLGRLLRKTGRLEEAEPALRRALEIDDSIHGRANSDISRDLNGLCKLLQATNRLDEAEPLIRRALAMDEELHGPDHTDVARDLLSLGSLLQARGQIAEAEKHTARALELFEAKKPADAPIARQQLADIRAGRTDTAPAVPSGRGAPAAPTAMSAPNPAPAPPNAPAPASDSPRRTLPQFAFDLIFGAVPPRRRG